jgi:AcrR family transcriptional regulator
MVSLDADLAERPRRRDAQATRRAILDAAKGQFARSGYEAALLRDIASAAGADAALINRYFGGKEGLFAAVLDEAVRSERLFEGERARFGRNMAKWFAAIVRPEGETRLEGFQIILRAAMSPTTAPMLSKAVQAKFLGPIRDWLGGEDAQARARLIAAMFIGLLVEAMVRDAPLPERERGAYVDRLGAIMQSLVNG